LSRHLALATNGVVFLQWTRSGDTHTGTLTQAYTGPGDRAALKHQNGQLTGVLSGSLVTPNFPQVSARALPGVGTPGGDTLILSYAAPWSMVETDS
jgi:hypothetical protein